MLHGIKKIVCVNQAYTQTPPHPPKILHNPPLHPPPAQTQIKENFHSKDDVRENQALELLLCYKMLNQLGLSPWRPTSSPCRRTVCIYVYCSELTSETLNFFKHCESDSHHSQRITTFSILNHSCSNGLVLAFKDNVRIDNQPHVNNIRLSVPVSAFDKYHDQAHTIKELITLFTRGPFSIIIVSRHPLSPPLTVKELITLFTGGPFSITVVIRYPLISFITLLRKIYSVTYLMGINTQQIPVLLSQNRQALFPLERVINRR